MKHVCDPAANLDAIEAYDAVELTADTILSANENPDNLPSEIVDKLVAEFPEFRFNRYPDSTASKLRERIAEANGLDPENVLIGNGGDELLFNTFLAWGGSGRTFLNMPPTFSVYAINAKITGTRCVNVNRTHSFDVNEDEVLETLGREKVDIVIIANPNNPTGNLTREAFLVKVLEATDALVIVDEAYFEFSRQTMRPHMMTHKNLVILRTFSKAFSLAGMRVGYILAHEDVIDQYKKVRQPYSVDAVSQWIASNVYKSRAAFEQTIQNIIRGRDQLIHGLGNLPEVEVFDSEANYVLFRIDDAHGIWEELYEGYSVLVRDVSRDPLLENCLRVTVGTEAENERFLDALGEIIRDRRRNGVSR